MSSIYLSNAIFMMIILTIIFLRIRYYITWSPSKKYTMIFIGMVELYVLMDALFMKELLGKSGNLLQFKLVVFFFYLVYVIMPYVWHLFMQSYMGINRSKKQRFAEMIPFILLILMVLLSVPTGIVWRFSRNRTYIRGTFFGVFAVLNLFYYVYTFAQTFFILFMNNTKGVRYLIKSALFSAVPLIGILVNTYIIPLYGVYPFQPYCLVIGALLSYLFMVEHQQNQMEFEHRKRLSNALELEKESTRKAKVAGEVKNAFLANMSHDIRTPLTSLDGYFQLMEECENVEDQRRYLNIIHERIHSLNEMLEELFTFTKLKNESYSLELTPCCINRILKETVFSYYDDWVRRGIQPDIQITEELLSIAGNKQGLHRVIQNVIKNGLDHGEKKISIVLERKQERAVLRISNQVIHSEQIDIEHVFDRFYKADVARSKTSTGLGLSIAKELVKRMNGEISAKTEKNEFAIALSFPLSS